MKNIIMKFKIIAVLVSLTYLSFAVPTQASDFFPLDLWEEMTRWQQNIGAVNEGHNGADSEPMRINLGKAGVVHTTFPFDVWEELNALGSSHRHDSREYFVSFGNTHRIKTNPYWLPEEFTAGVASGLTTYAKRNNLN
jgi:hypothetical protein